jgi:hypothetical protein
MKHMRVAVGIAGVALLATSCASGGDSEPAAAPEPAAASTPTAPVDTAQPATSPSTPSTPTASAPTGPVETTADAGTALGTEPAPVVPEALRFTAPAVGGGEIDVASFAGRPTVFWFWAPT